MSNMLVVESDDSAQMGEVQSRPQMDTITELQEEEDWEEEQNAEGNRGGPPSGRSRESHAPPTVNTCFSKILHHQWVYQHVCVNRLNKGKKKKDENLSSSAGRTKHLGVGGAAKKNV